MRKVILCILVSSSLVGLQAFSDDDWFKSNRFLTPEVAPVKNQVYLDECGSCHFPYQPGFLPQSSWDMMMKNLEDHFGDNAELDQETLSEINQFISQNSADKSNYRWSKKSMRSASKRNPPLRISNLRYIRSEHNEVPKSVFKKSKKIENFSQCELCHRQAAEGSFRERDIIIPGIGRWDD